MKPSELVKVAAKYGISASVAKLNQAGSLAPNPVVEPPLCHDPMAAPQGETRNAKRLQVRITSFRRRLLDPDNLAGGCKYFVDCCRFAKLIPGDRPQDIILETRQEKVNRKEEERTEVEISPL